MKQFKTSITISAPADSIWSVLTDAPNWSNWNSTVDRIEGQIASGEKVTVYAKVSPGPRISFESHRIRGSEKMVWSGGMPLGLFKGLRTYTLTPQSNGKTVFHMEEAFPA